MEKRELSYIFGGNVNWYNHYREQYGGPLKMLKTELLYDPAIPLLGIYLEKALTHNNTSSLFMEPRFCNGQHLKASYMSSTDEWLKKM